MGLVDPDGPLFWAVRTKRSEINEISLTSPGRSAILAGKWPGDGKGKASTDLWSHRPARRWTNNLPIEAHDPLAADRVSFKGRTPGWAPRHHHKLIQPRARPVPDGAGNRSAGRLVNLRSWSNGVRPKRPMG